MPPQVQKSSIMAKLGNRLVKAFEAHKHDETEVSAGGDLPAGLSGIAELRGCKFDIVKDGKENAGQPFFYAYGVVVSPKKFTDKLGNLHIVEGQRTPIIEMLCDTPKSQGKRKTLEDHLAWVLNQLRLLGVPTAGLSVDKLEATMQVLVKQKPTFRFRTWAGEKQTTGKFAGKEPRVQHTWEGAVDFEPEVTTPASGTEDDSETGDDSASTEQEETQVAPVAPSKNGVKTQVAEGTPPKTMVGKKQPDPEPQQQEFSEFGDLDALLEAANNKDKDAQIALAEYAVKAGHSKEVVTNTDTWEEVVELINNPTEGSDSEDEAQEEEPEVTDEEPGHPEVGQVANYKPFDAKKKVYLPVCECEIKEVDTEKTTVTLLNLDDGKTTYKNVKWEKLIPME